MRVRGSSQFTTMFPRPRPRGLRKCPVRICQHSAVVSGIVHPKLAVFQADTKAARRFHRPQLYGTTPLRSTCVLRAPLPFPRAGLHLACVHRLMSRDADALATRTTSCRGIYVGTACVLFLTLTSAVRTSAMICLAGRLCREQRRRDVPNVGGPTAASIAAASAGAAASRAIRR